MLRESLREPPMRRTWGGGNVALEAKPLGEAGVEYTAALISGLMVVTTTLQKLVKHIHRLL
jgi:hypothetical protein